MLRPSTWLSFLRGDREAIVAAANSRGVLWLGLLFVLSAGFAREYDAEDLLHEPWHVFLPLGASLLTSFLLFLLLTVSCAPRGPNRRQLHTPIWKRYAAFLALYWLTAPMAWLYAIPVERFLNPATAVGTNLVLLGVVSLWRVVLMAKIVAFVYSRSATAAVLIVMFFAETIVLYVMLFTPLPIINVMGGVALSASHILIARVKLLVTLLAMLTWLGWLGGALIAAVRGARAGAGWDDVLHPEHRTAISPGLWALAVVALLIWIPVLPFTQAEQVNRRIVESDLRAGRFEAVFEYMSARQPGDFPPHWEPPPDPVLGEQVPSLIEVFLAAEAKDDVAPWVREVFREKLLRQGNADGYYYESHAFQLEDMDDAQLQQYVELLETNDYGERMALFHHHEVEDQLLKADSDFPPEAVQLSDERRALFQRMVNLVPEEFR